MKESAERQRIRSAAIAALSNEYHQIMKAASLGKPLSTASVRLRLAKIEMMQDQTQTLLRTLHPCPMR